MKILAIESSCDETAAAVVEDGRTVLSSVIASQVEEHRLYGGVVPEIASRRHAEAIVSAPCWWASTLPRDWRCRPASRLFRCIICVRISHQIIFRIKN